MQREGMCLWYSEESEGDRCTSVPLMLHSQKEKQVVVD